MVAVSVFWGLMFNECILWAPSFHRRLVWGDMEREAFHVLELDWHSPTGVLCEMSQSAALVLGNCNNEKGASRFSWPSRSGASELFENIILLSFVCQALLGALHIFISFLTAALIFKKERSNWVECYLLTQFQCEHILYSSEYQVEEKVDPCREISIG